MGRKIFSLTNKRVDLQRNWFRIIYIYIDITDYITSYFATHLLGQSMLNNHGQTDVALISE